MVKPSGGMVVEKELNYLKSFKGWTGKVDRWTLDRKGEGMG